MTLDMVSLGLACADVMVRPVDEPPAKGRVNLVPVLEIHLGGLAGVTAAVFARLGGSAAFIGRLGDDRFADFLHQQLADNGVMLDGLIRAPRGSGEGSSATVVLIDSEGERTFLHQTGAARGLTEADVDFDLVSKARLLHWGGPGVTPSLDGEPIGRVLKRARELGLQTSMDTCYDGEGLWAKRIEHALPHLDIVMSSLEEARMCTGQHEPEDIAAWYHDHGPSVVVVKLGPDGLLASDGDETLRVPSHRVEVVDTTGAGDASCGGFLYAWLQGWGLGRCARVANAVGALTVQHMGGSEGVASLDEVLELADQAL
jgi:sugar/nucleoside kinase (ribokinase family)